MLQKAITRVYNVPYLQQNRGILTEIHISDIHFGIIDPSITYDILYEQFINKISSVNFDVIYIDGDLFDHKVQASSNTAMYAIKFVDKLVEICRQKNATLVLLHGTSSHDSGQLKLFYHYLEDKTIDIRIIEKICFEYIKNKRVLCIPEEYNKGKEYYDKFLEYSGLYDGVCLHGAIKGSIYGCDVEDLSTKKNPVFSIDSFKNCMGPIIAGHVHVAGCFSSHIYYNGSPIRWNYGEEEQKGFVILLHNLDTQQYHVHYEEIKSFRYDTVNLDHMVKQDPRLIMQYVNDLQSQGIDHIRLEFTIENEETLSIIRSYYKTNDTIKLHETYKVDKHKKEMLSKLQERYSEYDYILDDNISPYEKLTMYINQNKGYTYITTEELENIVRDTIYNHIL